MVTRPEPAHCARPGCAGSAETGTGGWWGVSTQQSFLGQLVLRAAFTETPGWEWRGERAARLGVQMKPDPNPAQTELCTIPVS